MAGVWNTEFYAGRRWQFSLTWRPDGTTIQDLTGWTVTMRALDRATGATLFDATATVTGGAVAYVGGAQVDIDAYRFAYGAVNMAGGSTDLWEISNVGSLRIKKFRLRHTITAGSLRLFKGDASGHDRAPVGGVEP